MVRQDCILSGQDAILSYGSGEACDFGKALVTATVPSLVKKVVGANHTRGQLDPAVNIDWPVLGFGKDKQTEDANYRPQLLLAVL